MPVTCAQVLCQASLLSALVDLLHVTQAKVSAEVTSGGGAATASATGSGAGAGSATQGGSVPTCKWLAPLLLLLDTWEKTLVLANWTRPSKKVKCLRFLDL